MGEPRPTPVAPAATDAELIARWKRGDQRAATELVERHSQPLARFAASLGERDGIEELVQDTFVRAFHSLDSFRADSSLRTWLFTICKRLILDRKRAERRRRNGVELEEGHAVVEYDALDALVADETARKVQAAVDRLSPLQREVFTLRVAEGMPYGEIAKVVESTEGACRVHYHNAMRTIKEYLSDD
jgi:RNA polymerase sigma-70 factor, ECF subfamily